MEPAPPPPESPLPFTYGKRLDDLDVLARSSLLRGLGIRDVGTFLELLDQVALPHGTAVMREGEGGDQMFFVLEGTGRARRAGLDLHSIGPGDHFGELALLGGRARPVTVEADTTMRLARLSRARYLSLATSHPRVALHFTQALATALSHEVIAYADNVGLLVKPRSVPRRLQVRVALAGDGERLVANGALVGSLFPPEVGTAPIVAGMINRRAVSLDTPVVSDCAIAPLTIASWEGRNVYLRSAALVALEAAHRVAPTLDVRVSAYLENGIVLGAAVPDRERLAGALEAELRRLVDEDVPLREEMWAVDEARADLQAGGASDAASLLFAARESTTTLAVCGHSTALAMGPLLTRAGAIGRVSAAAHPLGVLVRFETVGRYLPAAAGVPVDPAALEGNCSRFRGEMVASSKRWHDEMALSSVAALARRSVSGRLPELVRVAEGFHEKWIGQIADAIYARKDTLAIIAVAGPTASGKTTFIKRLNVQLMVDGVRPLGLSLDDYYIDRARTPRDEDGSYDFEAPGAIDGALFRAHLGRLLAGETVATARYDFVAGKSAPAGGPPLAMSKGSVLLVEGIHGFDPELYRGVVAPERIFRIFVHPARPLPFDRLNVVSPEDVRLLRRLVRDRHQRNYSAAETIARWPSVRRGELLHLYPRVASADAVFDTSLVYELAVLKPLADRYLLEIGPEDPSFTTANRLRHLLDPFVAVGSDHVPPTSVIREFIGGSGFEY